ncbi:MAG: preprotein translocase subunit SecG [Nitrospiraceae bacterium]|nr:preprotein translocase subunit SecG [Nitrospiraceae bacterium]
MTVLITIIHILVCVFLIFVVLVQGGRGAELGAAFGGGSSQTLFGGRGAATFLSKVTTTAAIVFMVTSLLLTMLSFRGAASVVRPVPMQAPAMPGAAGNIPGPARPGNIPGQQPNAAQPGAAKTPPAGK